MHFHFFQFCIILQARPFVYFFGRRSLLIFITPCAGQMYSDLPKYADNPKISTICVIRSMLELPVSLAHTFLVSPSQLQKLKLVPKNDIRLKKRLETTWGNENKIKKIGPLPNAILSTRKLFHYLCIQSSKRLPSLNIAEYNATQNTKDQQKRIYY